MYKLIRRLRRSLFHATDHITNLQTSESTCAILLERKQHSQAFVAARGAQVNTAGCEDATGALVS